MFMSKFITGKWVLAAAIMAAGWVAAGEPVELTFQNGLNDYQGTLDNMLYKGIPAANFGKSPKITISGVPWGDGGCFMLIKFDKIIGKNAGQIPPDARIISASLSLYKFEDSPKNDGQYESNYISLFPMLSDFEFGSGNGKPQENAVCFLFRKYSVDAPSYWGNKNQEEKGPVMDVDYDNAKRMTAILKVTEKDVWINWDISKIAAAWPAKPDSNKGMLLFAAAYYEGIIVAGANYPDAQLRPKLTVKFETGPAAASK